jgi:hypothetical protein
MRSNRRLACRAPARARSHMARLPALSPHHQLSAAAWFPPARTAPWPALRTKAEPGFGRVAVNVLHRFPSLGQGGNGQTGMSATPWLGQKTRDRRSPPAARIVVPQMAAAQGSSTWEATRCGRHSCLPLGNSAKLHVAPERTVAARRQMRVHASGREETGRQECLPHLGWDRRREIAAPAARIVVLQMGAAALGNESSEGMSRAGAEEEYPQGAFLLLASSSRTMARYSGFGV